jgi:hypothetical protein
VGCVPFTPDYACCEEWDSLDPELAERATTLAWSTLNVLSAGQVGNCPTVVRPCITDPCDHCNSWWGQWWSHGWVHPDLRAGEWSNCICPGPQCGCEPLCEIVMPGMVAAIFDVCLGGASLGLNHFRVENGHRIVRTDGECWPACLDLYITYLPGIVPDAAALWAAGVLACEFAKACAGAKCRLPSSVSSIARQGVTMTISSGMFLGGQTGIREVDAYLVAVNPNAQVMPPVVWSPDAPWAKHRYLTPTARVVP